MFNNILVYVNPDLPSNSLITYIQKLTKTHQSTLTLIGNITPLDTRLDHSIPTSILKEIDDDKQKKVEYALQVFQEKLADVGINTRTTISRGTDFIEICKEVKKNAHNLVVLAAGRKQSGLSKAFFGSTQMELLRKCPSAVLVVKEQPASSPNHILAAIDVGVDDANQGGINDSILAAVEYMSKCDEGTIDFLQVWSLYGEPYFRNSGVLTESNIEKLRKERKQKLRDKLQALVDLKQWNKRSFNIKLRHSEKAASQIIQSAKKKNVDLLVMGTLCRTGIKGFFIGNTAEKVLMEVSCSVLALKPSGFVSPLI